MASPPRRPLKSSLTNHVGVELDAAVDLLLEDALHLVVESWEAIERLLEGEEVVEHRVGPLIPALSGHHHANPWRVDQRKRGRYPALDAVQRDVVHVVRYQRLVGFPGRHRELREAGRPEGLPLELLDVRLAVEVMHLLGVPADR